MAEMKSGLPIDVHALLYQRGVESLRLEYKPDWNHVSGGQVLRTICAFANDLVNVNGGYVLIGVDEEDGRPVLPVRGLPEGELDALQRQIQGAINRIEPRYTPMIVPVQVEDRWVLVIVCPGGDGRPYTAPESLAKDASRALYVRVHDQTRTARGALLSQLLEVSQRVPLDHRVCYEAEVGDIAPDLVRHHLRQIGGGLADAPLAQQDLFYKLHLLRRIDGHEAPRNVALLFFAHEPRRWFPGARVVVASQLPERCGDGYKEVTFDGPLLSLIQDALTHLRGLIPIRIPRRWDPKEVDRVDAWPFDAVEEALLNAIQHRGYDVPDAIRVEVLPHALRVMSFPGPVPGVTLDDLQGQDPPPVPARNGRIVALLHELGVVPARRTGLGRIRAAMAHNGSPPPHFRFDEDRTYFEVTLPIHPLFLRSWTERRAQPLRLGRPAPPDEVVGREALVAQVLCALETQSVLLVGPKGRGVSTALGAVAAEIRKIGAVFELDLEGVSPERVVNSLLAWLSEQRAFGTKPAAALAQVITSVERRQIKPLAALVGALDAVMPLELTLVLDNLEEDDRTGWMRNALLQALARHPTLRLIAGLQEVAGLEADEVQDWMAWTRVIVVAPLEHAAARELTLRLVRGCPFEDDVALADEVARISAGLPQVLTRLVEEVRFTGRCTPAGVLAAFETLIATPGDPAGLNARVESFDYRTVYGLTPAQVPDHAAVLDLLAAARDGVSRDELLTAVVAAGRPRVGVLAALCALAWSGWVVEVDGVVRFEGPWIAKVWREARARNTAWEVDPLVNDEIPF